MKNSPLSGGDSTSNFCQSFVKIYALFPANKGKNRLRATLRSVPQFDSINGVSADERDRVATERRAVKRLEGLGYTVRLERLAQAA